MKWILIALVFFSTLTAVAVPRENAKLAGFNVLRPPSEKNNCTLVVQDVEALDGKAFTRIRRGPFKFTVDGSVFSESLDQAVFTGEVEFEHSKDSTLTSKVYTGKFSAVFESERLGTQARIDIETIGRDIILVSMHRMQESGEFKYVNGCTSFKPISQ